MNKRKIARRIVDIVNICLCLIILIALMKLSIDNFSNNVELNTERTVAKNKDSEKPIEYEIEKKIEYEIGEKLSEHSLTNYSSYGNRNVNLDNASRKISGENGMILKPRDEFNWFEVIGATTADKGYKVAGVIIDGQHAEALGGGVCQVATTLNSAAIKSGLQTQALKHSKKPGYLGPNDYEATVAYGSKNFRFTNTFDYPILVKMWAEGNTVHGEIYKENEKEIWIFHEKK